MAIDTNTFLTFQDIGVREDLSDMIYRISPTETPFMSGAEKEKATAVLHEWQTQVLATPNGSNAALEGDDALQGAAAVTPTVRIGNVCQISNKVVSVSGTAQAVDAAGRDNELAYQEMLKGLELKRDMETVLTGTNQAAASGSSTVARNLASLPAWMFTNNSFNASTVAVGGPGAGTGTANGANPTAANGLTPRTDATTQIPFTEARLKFVLSNIWTAGGKPNRIQTGAFNKQVFSTFTGRSSPIEEAKSKKIVASVDAYDSDFGELKVSPSRFQRARDVWVLEDDMWAVAYLQGRKLVSFPLAKTGDSDKREILSEYTLVSRNEASSGAIFDCTTA
jgi:Family of unknown function (DUF5309)